MKPTMYDAVAMGELLIDFTPAGHTTAGNELYERNPGGAPANVLVALARLGGKGCFIGKVGDDNFGRFLRDTLEQNGVSPDGLVFTGDADTTLAFVHIDRNGDRSFSFYRRPGADTLMSFQDVDKRLLEDIKVFHFGAVSLTDEPARSACMWAAEYAGRNGALISFDPNWRPPLWESDNQARECMIKAAKLADIMKVSEEEMVFITGESGPDKGSEALLSMGVNLVFVTLGVGGCYFRNKRGAGYVSGFAVSPVDTTGAGDAFTAGVLYRIVKSGVDIDGLDCVDIREIAAFSNAIGALCVQKRGAIPAMPYLNQVENFMKANQAK